MIPAHKRNYTFTRSLHFFENMIKRFYNRLTVKEMMEITSQAIKEGVFLQHHDNDFKWYLTNFSNKLNDHMAWIMHENKNNFHIVTMYDSPHPVLRSIYKVVKRYDIKIENGHT